MVPRSHLSHLCRDPVICILICLFFLSGFRRVLPPNLGLHFPHVLPAWSSLFHPYFLFQPSGSFSSVFKYISPLYIVDSVSSTFLKFPADFLFSPYFPVRPVVTWLPVPESTWCHSWDYQCLPAQCISQSIVDRFLSKLFYTLVFYKLEKFSNFLQFSSFLFRWLLFATFPHWSSRCC